MELVATLLQENIKLDPTSLIQKNKKRVVAKIIGRVVGCFLDKEVFL